MASAGSMVSSLNFMGTPGGLRRAALTRLRSCVANNLFVRPGEWGFNHTAGGSADAIPT
jgi:hypothetical protein